MPRNSLQILVIPVFMYISLINFSYNQELCIQNLSVQNIEIFFFKFQLFCIIIKSHQVKRITKKNHSFYNMIIMINISKETIFLRLYQKWQIVNWEPYHSWMHKKEKVNTRKIMIETWMEFNFSLFAFFDNKSDLLVKKFVLCNTLTN